MRNLPISATHSSRPWGRGGGGKILGPELVEPVANWFNRFNRLNRLNWSNWYRYFLVELVQLVRPARLAYLSNWLQQFRPASWAQLVHLASLIPQISWGKPVNRLNRLNRFCLTVDWLQAPLCPNPVLWHAHHGSEGSLPDKARCSVAFCGFFFATRNRHDERFLAGPVYYKTRVVNGLGRKQSLVVRHVCFADASTGLWGSKVLLRPCFPSRHIRLLGTGVGILLVLHAP